ncbi:MAG: GNAT family N-acetyltransferase [Bacteroidetes bacterium]|nr:GNAT family N-acetyltransferase [Bacteroidota bacterium]
MDKNYLKNKNILLRAPEPEDLELLYKWENDTSVWQAGNTLSPFSKFILRKFIENSHKDIHETRQQRFMIDLQSKTPVETIGTIDLFDYDPFHERAGIGILIMNNKIRQRGYATEALQALINYSFEILRLHQLFANVDVENSASLKLFEKHGFRITGEKKEWTKTPSGRKDEYFLQLLRTDR